jgi:hypothetical protein
MSRARVVCRAAPGQAARDGLSQKEIQGFPAGLFQHQPVDAGQGVQFMDVGIQIKRIGITAETEIGQPHSAQVELLRLQGSATILMTVILHSNALMAVGGIGLEQGL